MVPPPWILLPSSAVTKSSGRDLLPSFDANPSGETYHSLCISPRWPPASCGNVVINREAAITNTACICAPEAFLLEFVFRKSKEPTAKDLSSTNCGFLGQGVVGHG